MKLSKAYFAALVVLVCMLLLFGWLLHTVLRQQAAVDVGQANQTFTRHFVNENWGRLGGLLPLGETAEQIRANPAFDQVDALVRQALHGTDLVMLKIYDARGHMVYGPDPATLGQSRSDNEGFLAAVKGHTHTRMYHNDIAGFDGKVRSLDLVSSYVPVKADMGVQAVVEVYRDHTEAAQAMKETWWQAMTVFAAASLAAALALVWLLQRLLGRAEALEAANHALEDGQRQAREATEQAEWDKRWFLGEVGAELQQPLKQLKHHLQQLQGQLPAGAGKQHLQEGWVHAELLDQRVADFQALVALEGGELQAQQRPFHLGGLVRQLGTDLCQRAQAKRLECLVHVAPAVDRTYLGDADKLEKVLSVLLDNALRYTESGSVQLRAHASAASVLVDVVDTGPGLDAAQLHALLRSKGREAAFQSSTTRGALDGPAPRISVGLALAEGLTELIGGQMMADSTPGRGSWFTVRLPLEPWVDQAS